MYLSFYSSLKSKSPYGKGIAEEGCGTHIKCNVGDSNIAYSPLY